MELERYRPRSMLITRQTRVLQPRFPAIDAHNHLAEPFGGGWDRKPLSELLDLLDQAGVRRFVDLDGGWGEDILQAHLEHFKQPAPERFMLFGGVDWSQWPELGRQPYTARRFFIQYADRILFGSDFGPDLEAYRLYYRFLETSDEYFNYNVGEVPLQGRWHVSGLYLPDEVLAKVYYRNAERLFGGTFVHEPGPGAGAG